LLRCGAGTASAHIDATGAMHLCTIWRDHPFRLLERPASEWTSHLAAIKAIPAPAGSDCNTCRHQTDCLICPALSRMESPSRTAGFPVPYLCDICREQDHARTS